MSMTDKYPISTGILFGMTIILLAWLAVGLAIFIPAGQWTLWVLTATIISLVGFVSLCFAANAEEKGGY